MAQSNDQKLLASSAFLTSIEAYHSYISFTLHFLRTDPTAFVLYLFICFTMINNIKNKVKNDKKYILNGKIQKKIYFEFLCSQDKSWNFKKVSVIFYPIFILHMPCFYNIHIAGRYICVCKNDSLIP